MTNIIFSRKEFEKHIKLTPEIQDKITLFGTPLESVSKDTIEVEVFANRPDLISLNGFIRSFKQFLGKSSSTKYSVKNTEKDYKVYVDDSVNEIRPYIACAVIKKVNLNEDMLKDLINMQEKLALTLGRNRKKVAIGIYPLDKISMPIKYLAKNPSEIKFRPLGSDLDLNAEEILNVHPTGRKYVSLLSGSKRYPILVDSKGQILSMPPIINSEASGRVEVNTIDLFIECTGYDVSAVEKTLDIIVTSVAEFEGTICKVEIVSNSGNRVTPALSTQKTKISVDNVNKLLGLELNESQVQKLLEKMGHSYKKGVVESPSWRIDILHEVDLIEDIAIAYGYENLVPELPNISTSGQESKESIIKRKLSEILIGLGMLEISTYHLIKQDEKNIHDLKDCLELLDSKNEYKYLRPNLFVPMLRIISENKDAEYPQKLFEIGRVFSRNNQKENGIEERDNLIIGASPSNSTEIKRNLDYLFKMLEIDYQIKNIVKNGLIDGRTSSIIVNNKIIGYFGDVHPNTLKECGANMPLSVAEISLDEIYKLIN
jgi:phenylalanyl-tRNA synthetase beta chain